MRHGFGLNFRKHDFVSVNREKMDVTIENGNCIIDFRDKQYIIENGEKIAINKNIDIVFNKQRGNRGRLTFFCDDSIKIFRSNHPNIQAFRAAIAV